MLETCIILVWKMYAESRHPRVQPHVLKDLFGGEKEVETVKIVPDRNVSSTLFYMS